MALTHTRYFRWDHPGAPVLSGTAGAFAAIVKACLVGVAGVAYGAGPESKFAAGWSVAFEDLTRNILVLRNSLAAGGTGCYLRIDDSNAQYAIIQCYESMSDIDTGVAPASSAVRYAPKSDAASTRACGWVAYADERTVYVNIDAMSATPRINAYNGIVLCGGGDIDAYIPGDPSCFLVGNNQPNLFPASLINNILTPTGGRGTTSPDGLSLSRTNALAAAPTPSAVFAARYSTSAPSNTAYYAVGGSTWGGSVTDGYPGVVSLTAFVADALSIRGRLRGVCYPLANVQGNPVGALVSAAGVPGGAVMGVARANAYGNNSTTAYFGGMLVETVLPWL